MEKLPQVLLEIFETSRVFASDGKAQPLQFKQVVGGWLAKIPGANRFFISNVFRPWASSQIGNLAFLKKLSDDRRDWRFHQSF